MKCDRLRLTLRRVWVRNKETRIIQTQSVVVRLNWVRVGLCTHDPWSNKKKRKITHSLTEASCCPATTRSRPAPAPAARRARAELRLRRPRVRIGSS
jgi:hypothetical protein